MGLGAGGLLAAVGGGPGLAWAATPSAARPGLFRSVEVEKKDLTPFVQWTDALERYFNEKSAHGNGRCVPGSSSMACAYRDWLTFLDKAKGLSPPQQIVAVNNYFNKNKYVLDPINWGLKDYWASPGQFFEKFGDCEDYAIGKYLSLRALGVAPAALRIVILMDMNLKVPHAIMALYQDDGDIIILDNQIKQPVNATRIRHYRPVYSVNENTWWRHYTGKKKKKSTG